MTSVPVKAPIEGLPCVHAVTSDEIMLRPGFLRKAMGVMRVLGDKGAIHIRSQLLDSPTLYSLTLALLEPTSRRSVVHRQRPGRT